MNSLVTIIRRLLSEQEKLLVSVYECQSFYGAGVGWVATASTDAWPPWIAAGEQMPQSIPVPSVIDEPDLPPTEFDRRIRRDHDRRWVWDDEHKWQVEVIPDLTDDAGWRYASAASNPDGAGFTKNKTWKSDIRRRMWTRVALVAHDESS